VSSTRYSPISSKLFAMSAAGTGASLLFMGSTAIENGSPQMLVGGEILCGVAGGVHRRRIPALDHMRAYMTAIPNFLCGWLPRCKDFFRRGDQVRYSLVFGLLMRCC